MNHPEQNETNLTETVNVGPQAITLQEVDDLSHEIQKLLNNPQREFAKGPAREKLEQLERCMQTYRLGITAAEKISSDGITALTEARAKLSLALEEQLRLDDEGGNPPIQEQLDYIDQLNSAIRRMDRVIPVVETHFTPNQPKAA